MKQRSIVKKILYKQFINRVIPSGSISLGKAFPIKIITVIILTMITLAFLHSEFELFNFDEHNHGTHDYCEIVKTSTIRVTNYFAKSLVNLKKNNSICFHCVEKANQQITSYFKLDFEQFHTPQKNTDIYLHNRVFLI